MVGFIKGGGIIKQKVTQDCTQITYKLENTSNLTFLDETKSIVKRLRSVEPVAVISKCFPGASCQVRTLFLDTQQEKQGN